MNNPEQLNGLGSFPKFKNTPIGKLPNEWDVKYLPEVSINLDSKRKPIKSTDRADIQGKYPYYGASGIIDYVNDFIFDGEYILLGEDGENVLSRNLPLAFIVKGKSWVNNHAHVLEAKTGTSLKFLCEYLESLDYRIIASGSAQPKITQGALNDIVVPSPPFEEQQKIASILTAVDEVIASTTAQINKLKDLKTGMMQELLTRGIGRGGQPHTEFKDSPFGRIPQAWKFVRFDEVVTKVGSGITPSGGSAVYTTTGVPFIRSQNVYQDGLRWDDVCFISEAQHQKMKNSQLKPKDVLLNITGASIGRCYYLPDQFGEGNVNQHVCIIRCLDAMLQHIYLAHFINSDFGQKQIMNLQAGGNREGLNFQQIRAMELPLPPLDEQLEISKVILSMESNIGKRTAKLDSLCRLKKSLMQDLLTGKVRVQ